MISASLCACYLDFESSPLTCSRTDLGCGVIIADAPRVDAPRSGDTREESDTRADVGAACEGACVEVRCCAPELGASGCVDLFVDPTNCGACGVTCTDGQRCQGGACVADTCETGLGDCDNDPSNGCETSLESLEHCGRCGANCAPSGVALNGFPSCSQGSCSYACGAGFEDCDPEAPGCETDVNQATDCGGCGVSCLELPGAGAGTSCEAGVCAVVCDDGFADCDGDPTNGCEPGGAGTEGCPAISCQALLDAGQSASGLYWIDPDGAGAVETWCDMTTEGGGWTRVMLKVAGTQTGCASSDWDFARRLGAATGDDGALLSKIFTQSTGSESGVTPTGLARLDTGPYGSFSAMFAFTERGTSWEYADSSAFNMQLLSGPSDTTQVSWNFGTFSASKGYYFLGTHIAAYGAQLCNLLIHNGTFYNTDFVHELFIREL